MEHFRKSLLFLPVVLVVLLPVVIAFRSAEVTVSAQTEDTPGTLMAVDAAGKPKSACPLTHTDVKADITGFISRVVVTQQFQNPFSEKIEAVYTFPLPHNAAVDDMTMIIGERTIRGKIMPREEAEAVYDGARARGQTASLLNQERPNIFTQSVANIQPGDQIKITISYVETMTYEDGAYEFVFPMVVGPRYSPRIPVGAVIGYPFSPDKSTPAPDLSPVMPKRPEPGERSGHDISVEVTLDAGLIVDNLETKTHAVDIERPSPTRARVKLKDADSIPNKDFILRYDVAGKAIQDAVLTHRSRGEGYFTLILQPPDRVVTEDVTPKELVFVLDTSGSMSGFPIEKAKETMQLALDNLYPEDTFNLITFAGDTRILFEQPVRATKRNLRMAKEFLASTTGSGGTEMMTAIKAALEPSDQQSHMRIVCFLTDGFVTNDMEIIAEVQKHKNARVFAFGIGSSVNRFLLDNMATAGRGDVEYVGLNDDGSAAARRFQQRVRNPLLTDISIDWSGLPVADIYPQRIPDLFGAKPVVLTGRYTAPGSATIKLKGKMAGSEYVREIQVTLPETMALHDVLAPLWARQRIENVMNQDYRGVQGGNLRADLKNTITQLGLEFRLMTQFTSFVAVEEMMVTDGGTLRRIEVPLDVPEGVSRDSVGMKSLNYVGGGGPTGLFTVYNGQAIGGASGYVVQGYGKARARGRAAGGGGGGAGVGSGSGVGPGAGGNAGGGSAPKPLPNAPPSATVTTTVATAQASPMPLPAKPVQQVSAKSVEQQKAERLRAKLNPAVLSLIDRLKNKEEPTNLSWVRDRKAEVQLWLGDKSNDARVKLAQLEFEIVFDQPNTNLMIGRISLDRLEALAELDFVRYMAPQTR